MRCGRIQVKKEQVEGRSRMGKCRKEYEFEGDEKRLVKDRMEKEFKKKLGRTEKDLSDRINSTEGTDVQYSIYGRELGEGFRKYIRTQELPVPPLQSIGERISIH